MKKLLALIFMLILTVVLATSCQINLGTGTPSGGGDDDEDTYRVMIVGTEGVTVTSANPVNVKKGENAVFDVTIANTYLVLGVENGTYDEATGKVTVSNVKKDVRVTFNVKDMGYDVTKTYGYFFKGGEFDTSSVSNSSALKIGTQITVIAGDSDQYFAGWTVGAKYGNGGKVVSTDRTFTFTVGPEFSVNDSSINIYSNYVNTNVYYYDANGGKVDTNSRNIKNTTYYTATVTGSKVKVAMGDKYYSYAVAASTFWDDGTFYRDGYVLKEYNTKADGTGEGYSLGSKYYADYANSSSAPTLYCIWEQATPASAFIVSDVKVAVPTEKNSKDETVDAIHANRKALWNENGVIITQYTGNDSKVVIPEKINGKPVIAIAKDAFKNKDITTLVLSRFILKMEDGAFVNCPKLATIYYPDSIYYISDAVLDQTSYTSFKNFYVNATMAPGFVNAGQGAFAIKLCRILSTQDKDRIIVIAGSSTYQGLASEYMQELFDNKYEVVNFGTTRVCTGVMYLEAMQHYLHEGDIAILSPENHIRMMGDTQIFSSVIRDTQGMNNVYRYIDISNYDNVFTGFADFNQTQNYRQSSKRYEAICDQSATINKYGDYLNAKRQAYCGESGVAYVDTYYVTMNNRFKSRYDGVWNDKEAQEANKDYKDPNNKTWCNVDDPKYVGQVNRIIKLVQATGADVCFGFCPTDASKIVAESQNLATLAAFDKMFKDNYEFDAVLGSCTDYIYDHKYFYDCAYHVNDYGRTYRTYQLYLDICEFKGITNTKKIDAEGTKFEGCLFEKGSDGTPLTKVDYLTAK